MSKTKKFPEKMPEGVWPIIDHASTGDPDCCGCWIWQFNKTGENYITIICNECGEKRILLKKGNPQDTSWISKQEIREFCDDLLVSIARIQEI